jgi:hypothetical protein
MTREEPAMMYMLEIMYDSSVPVDPNRPSRQPEHAALEQQLREQGKYLGGGGLWPLDTSKRMQVRAGKPVVDGPFAEAKEVLGGFFVVECKDSDEALEIAQQIPTDGRSWIEVRRIGIWRPL